MAKKSVGFFESQRMQAGIASWILYIIAWAGALIFVIPLVWMITTSLKAPDQIFTNPPRWIPYSQLYLTYETKILARNDGKIKITIDDDGTKRIDLGGYSHVIPAIAELQVKKNMRVVKGDVLATLPTKGKVSIVEKADKTKVMTITDKGRLIKEYTISQDTKAVVKDGDTVTMGDKLADVMPQWSNYAKAWAPKALDETFTKYLMNTLIITITGIIGVLLSSTFVAYGFARFKFPYRDQLFLLMISTMMIPAQVTMIPTFFLFKSVGWIDTFAPLIVPTFLDMDISLSFKTTSMSLFKCPAWFKPSKASPAVIEPSPMTAATLCFSPLMSLALAMPRAADMDVLECPTSNVS